jgi:RNA polymerase sigma-70 factor (ECF subfamily)
MSVESLNLLLEKLCSGDDHAAEQAFLAYEPYLRKVVRRYLPPRLRAKFDSVDIVQSAWANLLHGFREAGWRFRDAAHLRAFLVQVTRNRFIDHVRHYRRALNKEEHLASLHSSQQPVASQPQPSEVMQADDLWEKMLALSPPQHHELLNLKRKGLSLGEIAVRTGWHPDSIRRVLRQLARRLALEQRSSPES